MRSKRVWARLASVEGADVVDVDIEEEATQLEVVVHVRPFRHDAQRCGVCRARCPGYDVGHGRRRWRSLDLGTVRVSVEADAPRVRCNVTAQRRRDDPCALLDQRGSRCERSTTSKTHGDA